MNLEESNEIYEKNKRNNAKKQTILGAIVLCVIVIIVCLLGIMYLNKKEDSRFRMYANGTEVPINPNLIKNIDDVQYVNVRELTKYTGYNYTQGDYVEVNESKDCCFIENDYEIVTLKAGETTFTKFSKNKEIITSKEQNEENPDQATETPKDGEITFLVKTKNGEKSNYVLEKEIKLDNDELWIPFDSVKTIFNASISNTEKSLNIYSLDYLYAIAGKIAENFGYTSISSTYENVRAIANNMIIVEKDDKYGVLSMETNDGNLILGVRYDDIVYMQNENKFYVYLNSKMGLVDAEGKNIISSKDYESIEIFDVDKKLYLVKNDNKYGILNSDGETVLYTDFDSIGISDSAKYKELEKLQNKDLWFGNILAVRKGTTYELYNVDEKAKVSATSYAGFGYKIKTTDTAGEENTLLIPASTGVEGIVVSSSDGLYGIYDRNKKQEIIPCLCTRIYHVSNNGVTTYYMEFEGNQLEMHDYFERNNLISVQNVEE